MIKAAKPLQVYVVEDSEIVLRLLTSAVESAGGELMGAADNAQQAIDELRELKPHLILIDLVLASGSGFDWCSGRTSDRRRGPRRGRGGLY